MKDGDDQKILRCDDLMMTIRKSSDVMIKCHFDWNFLIDATFLFQDSKTSLLQFTKIQICEYHSRVSRVNNLYIYKHDLEFFAFLCQVVNHRNFESVFEKQISKVSLIDSIDLLMYVKKFDARILIEFLISFP